MHGRHLQELLNRRLLPGCQGVMELHHVFQDGRLGEYLTDQRLDGLLYALERDHLRDQQVHHIAPDPWAVLHGAGHIGRERPLVSCPALGALLDLGVYVGDHLFKDDVDPGAPLNPLTGRLAQVFATGFALGDRGCMNGLNRAGVVATDSIVLVPLAVGAWVGDGGIVLGGLR